MTTVYEEWLKLESVQEFLGQTFSECKMCDGEGYHTCECGDEHDCGYCDGTGMEYNYREIYEEHLRDEIAKLLAWIRNVEEMDGGK